MYREKAIAAPLLRLEKYMIPTIDESHIMLVSLTGLPPLLCLGKYMIPTI